MPTCWDYRFHHNIELDCADFKQFCIVAQLLLILYLGNVTNLTGIHVCTKKKKKKKKLEVSLPGILWYVTPLFVHVRACIRAWVVICMYVRACVRACYVAVYTSLSFFSSPHSSLLHLPCLLLPPPPTVTFIGPVHTCPYAGLASLVPANNNLKVPLTYGQAKDICEQSGMVLRNDVDLWTRSCSHSFSQSVENTYKVEVFEINDPWTRATGNSLAAKRGVICTILNYCK